MPDPNVVHVEPLSASSLYVETFGGGRKLSSATAFVLSHAERMYLVTAWHVVSGRNAETDEPMSTTGALPDEPRVLHHSAKALGNWIEQRIPLQAAGGGIAWYEHPRGRDIDAVVMPLVSDPRILCQPIELAWAEADILVQPGTAVSIIGYPFGLSAGGYWPIWKTGHIASDLEVDFDGRPAFVIDATTRAGMSGAPVVLRGTSGYIRQHGGMVIGRAPTRFLGVYSGRIHGEAELGRVWRPSAIREIIDGVA